MNRVRYDFFSWQKLAMVTVVILASGCTTLSRRECETMNWSAKGRESALNGETVEQGSTFLKKACGIDHRIEPDFQAFQSGFENGLKEFCTAEASTQFARRGGRYQGTCPAAQHEKIVANVNSGRVEFLEKKLADLESKVSSLESENDRLKREKSDLEQKIQSQP